jgi:transcriptional regulator with XRE-family HTH domain
MAKNTMGTKLPRKLVQKMSIVGEQIKLARLRRNLSVAQIAERATCSPLTVSRIEKGIPTVAVGIYLRVLYALQLDSVVSQRRQIGKIFAGFEFEDKETSFKKGIERMSSYT